MRPRRREGEGLPAVLVGVLLVAVVMQFALPLRTDLPDVVAASPRRLASTPAPMLALGAAGPTLSVAPTGAAAAPTIAGAGPTSPAADLRLTGIVLGRGVATALVRGEDGRSRRLRPGQSVSGWRLAGLDRNRAVFIRGGERRVLSVEAASGGRGATQAPSEALADMPDRETLPVRKNEDQP